MKKIFNRIVALVMILTLFTAVFAGCGKSVTTPSTEDSKTSTASETSVSGEKITITYPSTWVGTDGKATVFSQIVSSFNKENEGKIEVKIEDNTDYNAYEDKIRTVISTGNAPDIFNFKSYSDLQLYSKSGKLTDLTSYLGDKAWSDNFTEGVISAAQFEGKNYAIPFENAVIAIMFNQKLLKDAGITTIPTTYEELWKACDALKAKGIFPTTQMTKDNAWTSMLWYSYALAATGGKDVYTKGLDDPAFVEAAKILQKMFTYTSPDAVGADATVVNGHFFNERAAIYSNGSWILSRIKKEGVAGLYDNIAVSAGLGYDGGQTGAYVNTIQAYVAVGKQQNPEKEAACIKFLKYLTEPEKVTELSNASGAIFTIKSKITDKTEKLQATMIEQSSAAPFMINTFESAMPTKVAAAFPSALEGLILGEYTPEKFVQVLKDADK
ncbi:MAG: ABC transporter substrate-binding protein [Ruminiclostridium sp.]